MQSKFVLFGPVHLLILAVFPVLAFVLTGIARKGWLSSGRIRVGLGIALVSEAAAQYGYFFFRGWLKFPDTLPLELCDATLCVATIALFTLNPLSVDLAYYGAIAGTSMALLMPDLWEPFPSYATVQFFIAHGLVITSVLYLIWSGEARPRPGSSWRALLALNIFASLVGTIDFLYGANYMYLRAKPQNPSLLDFFGRWPWYVLTAELVALALFTLLYLPFRSRRGSRTASLPPS